MAFITHDLNITVNRINSQNYIHDFALSLVFVHATE